MTDRQPPAPFFAFMVEHGPEERRALIGRWPSEEAAAPRTNDIINRFPNASCISIVHVNPCSKVS